MAHCAGTAAAAAAARRVSSKRRRAANKGASARLGGRGGAAPAERCGARAGAGAEAAPARAWGAATCGGGARMARDVRVRVGWDPENILGPPKAGHIDRRMFHRQLQKDDELKQKLEEETKKARAELLAKRAAREEAGLPSPGEHEKAVEYLLETEAEEIPFEVARIQNCLTEEWFAHVEDEVRMAKFDVSAESREDREAELSALLLVVRSEIDTIKQVSERLISPAEKLRDLFTAEDKKQHVLDMAGRNEIDDTFLNLLEQNISAAEHAEQQQAADFMKKLLNLCKRVRDFWPRAPASPSRRAPPRAGRARRLASAGAAR